MKLVKKQLQESMEGKYCIVAVKPDGSRVFYKDGDFVDSAKDCTIFTDHDEAIDVWYDIDKSAFRRVFVPNWSENMFESVDMNKRCEKCNTLLNDGGTCPKCDDGEEDYGDRDDKIDDTMSEAYDPQELNPDASGPIADMNAEFYHDLDKAIKEERWEDAAREYCEIKAGMDKELADMSKKSILGKLFKLFAAPHLRALDSYKDRIPAEYLDACK